LQKEDEPMTQSPSETTERYHVLDGVRGIAAIVVMLSHFTAQEFRLFGHPIVPFAESALAVDLFFVLSGFVLSHAYEDRIKQGLPFLGMLKRRIIRLYPMFFIGLIVGGPTLFLLIGADKANFSTDDAIGSLLSNLFFLPYFTAERIREMASDHLLVGPIFPANPPAWSLFFEMIASLCLLWLAGVRTRWLTLAVIVFYLGFIGYGVHVSLADGQMGLNPSIGWDSATFFGGFLRVGFGFMLGIVLYRLRDRLQPALRAKLPSWAVHPYFLYAVTFAALFNPFGMKGIATALTLLVVLPAIVAAGSVSAPGSASAIRISSFLGALSYPLYSLHYPIARMVAFLTAGLGLSNFAFMLLASATAVLVATAVGLFIDAPIRKTLGVWLHIRAHAEPARRLKHTSGSPHG